MPKYQVANLRLNSRKQALGQNHPVHKAYNYFRRATEGDPSVKPRAPITVRDNGDGTFTIIDGLATT
jgi:hypothetical protein